LGQYLEFDSDVPLWNSFHPKISNNHHMSATNAKLALWGFGVFALTTAQSQACAVCMGGKSGPLADATNGAIFLMLGLLVTVLGLISLVGYTLVRRGKQAVAGHVQLIESVSESNLS